MVKIRLKFYNRILFRLLMPVLIVGIICSTLVVHYMSAPMKGFLIRQFDANLRLASVMGLQACEDSFSYLLDLRLEKNSEMNLVMQNEVSDKIKMIADQFPNIHLLVLESHQSIRTSSLTDLPEKWEGMSVDDLDDKSITFDIGGKAVRSHVQYFPFWDWQVISFVYEKDYYSPIRMAFTATYLSAATVFFILVGTLLIVFQVLIKKPLKRLTTATDGVAEGALFKIDEITYTEFGRLMVSFNGMIESLENEKAEVHSLIHQLRESEALFRSQFEFGNIGITITSKTRVCIRANDRFCQMLGYSEEELKEMDWSEITHPEDLNTELENYNRLLAGTIESFEMDQRIIHKNGDMIYTHINVSCYRNVDQSIRFFIISLMDITARKRAEGALQQRLLQLKSIYSTLPVIVWSTNKEGVFTLSEGKQLEELGLRSGQVVGMSIFEVYKDNLSILDGIKRSLNGEVSVNEVNVNGNIYHSVMTPILGESQTVLGINGLAINVTEEKKAERELKQLRNYLSNIIDSMPSVLIGVDADGKVTQWNKRAEEITGISADNAHGKTLPSVYPLMASDLDKISKSIKSKEIKQEQKLSFQQNGENKFEEVTIFPLISNGVDGAVIRVDDVTEKTKLQHEILKLNEQLEKKIEERTRALKKSLSTLEKTQNQMIQSERMAAIGNMVAGIAHEINTPIGIGVTEASFLTEITNETITLFDSDKLTHKHFQKYLQKSKESSDAILRNLSRSADLIRNFKQVAVDQNIVELRKFNLKSYLDGILLSLKSEIKHTNHKITLVCPEDLMINSHPGAFAQITTNFIMNSLAHGFDGNEQGEIQIEINLDQGNLRFSYYDNGIGMDKKTLKQVFDPFFTTKRNQGGTGLGMQIVYNLVTQKLKGDISVNSSLGDGVEFMIKLPIEIV
jgi:PAS domain S-box-containing protein